MLRLIALVGLVALVSPHVTAAQSTAGHVYTIAEYSAHTGQEAIYSQGYVDNLRPVFNELVSQGAIVSYLDLAKNTGSPNSTHMILIEYPSWGAVGEFAQKLDAASRDVLGRPFSEVVAEFDQVRDPRGNEIYIAPPGGM
jgi:hypothetical protein